MAESSTRNALIKSINARSCDDFETEIVLVLELYQIKKYLKFTYKGEVDINSNIDSLYFCGGAVTFNELFVKKNTFKHTFLIDNSNVFQISSGSIKYEEYKKCDAD